MSDTPDIQIDETGRIIISDPKVRDAVAAVLKRLAANPDSVTGNDRCVSNPSCNQCPEGPPPGHGHDD
jgi:hypothetical protein